MGQTAHRSSGIIRPVIYELFFLADLALLVVALIDCISTDEYAVRNLPKVAWVLLILLFSPVGGIAWFVAGRPQQHRPAPAARWSQGRGFPEDERPRPASPDDASRNRARRDDEEMFSKWEADLRRREEELRRREGELGAD